MADDFILWACLYYAISKQWAPLIFIIEITLFLKIQESTKKLVPLSHVLPELPRLEKATIAWNYLQNDLIWEQSCHITFLFLFCSKGWRKRRKPSGPAWTVGMTTYLPLWLPAWTWTKLKWRRPFLRGTRCGAFEFSLAWLGGHRGLLTYHVAPSCISLLPRRLGSGVILEPELGEQNLLSATDLSCFCIYPVVTWEIELCHSFLALTLVWQLNLVSFGPDLDSWFPSRIWGCDLTLDGKIKNMGGYNFLGSKEGISGALWWFLKVFFFKNLLGIKRERGREGRRIGESESKPELFCWWGVMLLMLWCFSVVGL